MPLQSINKFSQKADRWTFCSCDNQQHCSTPERLSQLLPQLHFDCALKPLKVLQFLKSLKALKWIKMKLKPHVGPKWLTILVLTAVTKGIGLPSFSTVAKLMVMKDYT
uniref:Uncharacterized protein n=1 Tax=Glossina pallidipes TaxID=7398 RepID=A0A1B0A0L1_GLOPL